MKRFLSVLLIGFFFLTCTSVSVLANEEPNTSTTQEVEIDAAGAVALFLKSPRAAETDQVIKIRRSGLVLLLAINGKVPTKTESESK